MQPARARPLIVPLLSVLLIAPGCGGGGGGGSTSSASAAPGSTVVDGVAFGAGSDDLSDSPFGEAFGTRRFRYVVDGKEQYYLGSYTWSGTDARGVRSITGDFTFIDPIWGTPIDTNSAFNLPYSHIERFVDGFIKEWAFAKASDGWIYVVDDPYHDENTRIPPYKWAPSRVQVGTEWIGIHTYRVVSLAATGPRSHIPGSVVLATIQREEGTPGTIIKWSFYKAGIGLVEETNVDPASDQSTADGSYLVPDVG